VKKPNTSLIIYFGQNLTISIFTEIPNGLVDPFICNKTKCNKDKATKTKGNKKCNTKNLFNVGLSTEKPPHSQATKYLPIHGKAPNKLVITVAPHKDICPQGNT
jgi:hypothetical protein